MYTQIIFFLLISIGEMLVDEKVVGQNCENFKFTYEEGLNFKGERTFSNTNTGEFFRKSEIEIKSKWGNDVVPIFIILNTDKTHLTRLGQNKVWPFNIALANLTTTVLESKNGSVLAGYCPMLPVSDQSLSVCLNAVGIVAISKQEEACKMQRRKLEQDFFEVVLNPLKELESSGPILYRIGCIGGKVHRCMVKVFRYICT